MLSNSMIIGVYIVNFIVIAMVICFERRDPVVSIAWLLAFTAIPFVGIILFLVFGTGLKRKTSKKYAEKWRMNLDLSDRMPQEEDERFLIENKIAHDDIATYLFNTNNSLLTKGNHIEFLTDAESKFAALIHDIKNAEQTINLLYFIIRNDEIGNKIIEELTKKAKEGVEVRLLYDDIGCIITNKRMFKPLKDAGGKVSAFFPVKLGSYSKVNHRNHRKIVVIDGKIGYLGGINIGDEYYGKKKPTPWKDFHARFLGPSVRYLQKAFNLDWMFSTGEDLSIEMTKFFPEEECFDDDKIVQMACSGPDSKQEEIKCAMIKMINSTRKRLYIETPYFVPDQSFLNAVKIAANSGVDVRLIIPGKPDKKYVYYSTLSYVGSLLDAGVRVYRYRGFIHSKAMVADDICTMGTTNIDIRSFQLHFEMNAFIYDIEKTCEMSDVFLNDLKECDEITSDEYENRSFVQKILEGIFRLLSPIM